MGASSNFPLLNGFLGTPATSDLKCAAVVVPVTFHSRFRSRVRVLYTARLRRVALPREPILVRLRQPARRDTRAPPRRVPPRDHECVPGIRATMKQLSDPLHPRVSTPLSKPAVAKPIARKAAPLDPRFLPSPMQLPSRTPLLASRGNSPECSRKLPSRLWRPAGQSRGRLARANDRALIPRWRSRLLVSLAPPAFQVKMSRYANALAPRTRRWPQSNPENNTPLTARFSQISAIAQRKGARG